MNPIEPLKPRPVPTPWYAGHERILAVLALLALLAVIAGYVGCTRSAQAEMDATEHLREQVRLLGSRSAMLTTERDYLKADRARISGELASEVEQLTSEVESATARLEAVEDDNAQLTRKAAEKAATPSRGTSTRDESVRVADGRTYTLTAYCSCSKCCGPYDGSTTASGTTPKWGTVAAPKSLAFGTRVEIDGLGTFTVEDRGGAIKGDILDVWFPSHAEALAFGRQTKTVKILD